MNADAAKGKVQRSGEVEERLRRGNQGARERSGLELGLFAAGERVCVAVSGGADSTALLLALVEANRAKEALGAVLSAAHVHHGLRGAEADADEAFVRELCARVGVGLTVFRVDTQARQAAEGEGMEEAARELRYAALWGLMREGKVDVVATAHTLDDQAETVMMKLLRGAWTEGLGGISPVVEGGGSAGATTGVLPLPFAQGQDNDEKQTTIKNQGRIVRPMLGVRRAEVEAFLRSRGQGWREDASNADVRLTRNRVRHELMPVLRGFNPGVDGLLARMAAIARDEEAFWRAEVARVLPLVVLPGKPVRGGGRTVSTAAEERSCAVEIARLRAMSPALRRRVVRAMARTAGGTAQDRGGLSAEETAKVLALGGFGDGLAGMGGAFSGCGSIMGKTGSRLELRGGLRVERSARELRFWREPAVRAAPASLDANLDTKGLAAREAAGSNLPEVDEK